MAHCTRCGKAIREGSEFCTSCGTPARKVSASPPQAGPAPQAPYPQQAGPPPGEVKKKRFLSSPAGITLIICVTVVVIAGVVVGVVFATKGGSSSAPGITGAMADYQATMQELGSLIGKTPFAKDLDRSATAKQISAFQAGLNSNREKASAILTKVKGMSAPSGWEKAKSSLTSSLESYDGYLVSMDMFWGMAKSAVENAGATSCLDDWFMTQGETSILVAIGLEGEDTQARIDETAKDAAQDAVTCEQELKTADEEIRKQGGEQELKEKCAEKGVASLMDPAVLAALGPPVTIAKQLGLTVVEKDTEPPLDGGEESARAYLDEFLSEWLKYYVPPPKTVTYGIPEDNDRLGLTAVKDYMSKNLWTAINELKIVNVQQPAEYQWRRFKIEDVRNVTADLDSPYETWVFLVSNEGIDQDFKPDKATPAKTDRKEWYYVIGVQKGNDGQWKIAGYSEKHTDKPGQWPEDWENSFTMPGAAR